MRRWNSAWGTTVAMMVSLISARSIPASARSWLSHTMYSSDVRLLSVRMRQSPTIRSPSNRPNLTLVLLACSMAPPCLLSACRMEDVAGGDQPVPAVGEFEVERARGVEPGKAPPQHLALQANLDGLPQPDGEIEPAAPDRREVRLAPAAIPGFQPRRQSLQHGLDARLGAGGGQGGGAIGKLGGKARDIDAHPQHDRLDDSAGGFRLGQNAGDLGPVDQQIVRPFAAEPPARGQQALEALRQGHGGDEADLGRLGRRHPGAQQEGEIEIALGRAPITAAAPAPAALLARPDEGALRRAGSGAAMHLLIGAVDALEGDEREEGRELRPAIRTHPPKSDTAAACAAEKSGPGRMKNSKTASAATAMME